MIYCIGQEYRNRCVLICILILCLPLFKLSNLLAQELPVLYDLDFQVKSNDEIEIQFSLSGCNPNSSSFYEIEVSIINGLKKRKITSELSGDYPIVQCRGSQKIYYDILKDLQKDEFSGSVSFELKVLRELRSSEIKVSYNTKNVFIHRNKDEFPELKSFMDSYFNNNVRYYGTYKLKLSEKPWQTRYSISDRYNIDELAPVVYGPEAVLSSMLIPGLGTLKVSQREKGWKTMALFVAFTGAAIIMKNHSNREYDKYLAASASEDMNKYYDSANMSNKIAIISAGIATSIYLHDIYNVFKMGYRNKKDWKYRNILLK